MRQARRLSSRELAPRARREAAQVEARVAAAMETPTGWPTASHIRFTWWFRPSWSVSSTAPAQAARAGAAPSGRRRARRPRRGDGARPRRGALDVGLVDLVDLVAGMREPVRERAVVRQQERAGGVGVEPADRDDTRLGGTSATTVVRPLRIARGRDDAGRLVEQHVGERCLPNALPSTSTRSRRRRRCQLPRLAVDPTRPALINSSAPLREATPARARYAFSRTQRILNAVLALRSRAAQGVLTRGPDAAGAIDERRP